MWNKHEAYRLWFVWNWCAFFVNTQETVWCFKHGTHIFNSNLHRTPFVFNTIRGNFRTCFIGIHNNNYTRLWRAAVIHTRQSLAVVISFRFVSFEGSIIGDSIQFFWIFISMSVFSVQLNGFSFILEEQIASNSFWLSSFFEHCQCGSTWILPMNIFHKRHLLSFKFNKNHIFIC